MAGGGALCLVVTIVAVIGYRAVAVRERDSTDRMLPVDVYPERQPLIGESATVRVPVRNPSRDSSLSIEHLSLSCSCVEIVSFPPRVEPAATAEILCRYAPSAFDVGSDVALNMTTGGEKATTAILHVAPLPPFSGWPVRANGRIEGARVIIPISEEYAGKAVAGVRAFRRGATVEVPTTMGTNRIEVEATETDTDLVVCFGGDSPVTWSGPVFAERP